MHSGQGGPSQKDMAYREPPPYPGSSSSRSFLQPGYRQSYSGSETSTDVSLSSNENIRQDPQGEENSHGPMTNPVNYTDALQQTFLTPEALGMDTNYSILARLGMPVQSTMADVRSSPSSPFNVQSLMSSQVTHPHEAVHHYVNMAPSATMCTPSSASSQNFDTPCSFTTPAISLSRVPVLATEVQQSSQSMPAPNFHLEDSYTQSSNVPGSTGPSQHQLSLPIVSIAPVTAQIVRSQTAPVVLQQHSHPTQLNLTSSHVSNLSQGASLLSANTDKEELRRSYEVLDKVRLTRSQPDLSKMDSQKPLASSQASQSHQPQHTSSNQQNTKHIEIDHAAIATRATQMVELLSEENRVLREELEAYYKKVATLQKFEYEIQQVQDSHEALVQHSQKRENLEKTMRTRLETALRKMKHENRELKEQLDAKRALSQPMEVYDLSDNEMRKELSRKDSTITKLISQNKELTNTRERLEVETAAQKATIQEQRKHIEVLDSALMNAQTTIIKLEQQLRHRVGEEEKVAELQKILRTLQSAAEKREGLEQKLRGKLEEEIRTLKNLNHGACGKASDTDEGISSDSESPTSIQSLIQQMQEKEQRILELEAEVIKWEQKYLEETALRELAIDVAATPKDARIAALEQSSAETEKIIADVRTEKFKHMEEVYQANRKCAQLEAKTKMMAAQMAEKDAMIRVLQKHSSLSRTSSTSSILSSPLHSPHPSLTSTSSRPLSPRTSLSSSPRTPRQSISQSPSPMLPRASSTLPQRPLSATTRPLSPLVAKMMSRKSSTLDSNAFKDSIKHAKSNSTGSSVTLKEAKLYPVEPTLSDDEENVSTVLWQV